MCPLVKPDLGQAFTHYIPHLTCSCFACRSSTRWAASKLPFGCNYRPGCVLMRHMGTVNVCSAQNGSRYLQKRALAAVIASPCLL